MDDKIKQSPKASLGLLLIAATALLTTVGIIAIYAASALKGAEQLGDPYIFVRKQCLVAIAGFAVIAGVHYLPKRVFEHLALPGLIVSVVLLALVFVPGIYVKVGGASRWLDLGFIRFQTSELVKLALVFFLARNISRPSCDLRKLGPGTISNIAVFGVIAALLMAQPDFGSTVLLGLVTFSMMFISGLSLKLMTLSGLIGASGMAAAIVYEPYRMKRLLSFLDPWSEASRGGFQIIQSYLGFQNGGLLGAGLGESKQALFFLPEAHTDFILSVIGEELGLLGVLLVCLLFAYIVALGYMIAVRQASAYLALLVFGFTTLIGLQAVMNMGVVMGLLPTKGIPLPLVSNGATSLIVSLTMIGIIAKLGSDRPKAIEETGAQTWRKDVFLQG